MTRSNEAGDIGFMANEQRVTVLLSRARAGLFMIGNMGTFLKSRKGSKVWEPLFKLLRDQGSLHDGIPIQCERHPNKQSLLKKPEDFDTFCPDGGCDLPW